MSDRAFLHTTDELRRVACAIAGYRPGDTWRIIPVQQYVATLPKATPDDRDVSMKPDQVRAACGRAPKRIYAVGAVYGRLRLLSSRPTKWAGGKLYTCTCEVCGTMNEYAAGALNLAERRNRACAECMLRKVQKSTKRSISPSQTQGMVAS